MSLKRYWVLSLTIVMLTSAALAGPKPVIAVGGEDPYSGTSGLGECLKRLSVPYKAVSPKGKLTLDAPGTVLVGSFVTSGKDGKAFWGRNAQQVASFVKEGGVAVVLGQSADADGQCLWLPEPLRAVRSYRDARGAVIAAGESALVSQPNRLTAEDLVAGQVDRGGKSIGCSIVGATDVFSEVSGFQIVATADGIVSHPILMVGEYGEGAYVLTATSPEKMCSDAVSDKDQESGRRVMENLLAFAGGWPMARSTGGASTFRAVPECHRVEVYEDENGNGTREAGERPLAGVEVLYGLRQFVTDPTGSVSWDVDPNDPYPLSITVPRGFKETTPVFLDVTQTYHHMVGIRRTVKHAEGLPVVIYQLSDVHIGTGSVDNDAAILEELLRQVQFVAKEDDLVVFTGDVSQGGYVEQLQAFRDVAYRVKNPLLLVEGNHDQGKGPDAGRLYEELVGPSYYVKDWNGYRLVSVPSIPTEGPLLQWFNEVVSKSKYPVWVFSHYYPRRGSFDGLAGRKIAGVVSGHWHGDVVSFRNGMMNVNTPTALFGAWDFSPASVRRIEIERDGRVRSQLIPFVRFPIAALMQQANGDVLLGATLPMDFAIPTCTAQGRNLDLVREGPNAWRVLAGAVRTGEVVECKSGGLALQVQCGAGTKASGAGCSLDSPVSEGLSLDWAVSLPGRVVSASPVATSELLFVPLRNVDRDEYDGALCALSLDGQLRWCHYTPTNISAPPVVTKDVIIATEVTGDRWGLDPETGTVLWSGRLDDESPAKFVQHFMYSPGVVHRGVAYYCYQSGPFGVSVDTGEVVWQGQGFGSADAFGQSKGVVYQNRLYCAGFMEGLYEYDLKGSGTAKYEALPFKWDSASDLAMSGDTLWILARSRLVGYDVAGRTAKTEVPVEGFWLPTDPVLKRDRAIVPWGNTGVAKVELDTGSRSWLFKMPPGPMTFAINRHSTSAPVGTPLWGSRGVYVPGVDGVFRQLDPGTGEVLAEAAVGVPLVSDVKAKGDGLFVADYGGRVYRFSVR